MTDHELLAQYRQTHCDQAFAELVHRHVDWVYSSARRHVTLFRTFDPQSMTYHPRKMQDWASVTPD
jgi:hypothetical protein